MKKLLLILLCLPLLFSSCSKSGVTPQTMEEVIVGKRWTLDNGGFILSKDGDFYMTEKCGESWSVGSWIIEEDLIKYRYYQNSQEITILYGQVSEYTENQIKIVDYSNATTTVNLIYNIEVYGCTDSTADNYNENANCDDGSCSHCNNTDNCTYVPDDNFEQKLINYGYDNVLDDYVLTANINTLEEINLGSYNISDITGIEDFVSLTFLDLSDNQLISLDLSQNTSLINFNCSNNQLTNLDVSNNTALTDFNCSNNQLTNLDVSNNTTLNTLYCNDNQLISLDLSQNTSLTTLNCGYNQLTSLDVSNNTTLNTLYCNDNQLTSLDVRNTNNNYGDPDNALWVMCYNNSNLTCINVSDAGANTNIWGWSIDPQHYFSEQCP